MEKKAGDISDLCLEKATVLSFLFKRRDDHKTRDLNQEAILKEAVRDCEMP